MKRKCISSNGRMVALLLVLVIVPGLKACTPTTFDKAIGGSNQDFGFSGQQTSDGGYIMAGMTASYGAGSADVWLIKTNASGNKSWDKTYGGTGFDVAYCVRQTSDGGYIVTGMTQSYGSSDGAAWLIKTDASGNKVWDKLFDGVTYSVQQTTDGGYVLAGITESFGAGLRDAWLIKTDASGNELWDKTFGGPSDDWAAAVQQTTDGGYIVAGYTSSYGAGEDDVWLIKTDASGNELWDKTFGGASSDSAHAIQQTTDGGYILAGDTLSYGAGLDDIWLIKTDASGNKLWDKVFGGSHDDEANSVRQTSDGGYIIAGLTYSYGAGEDDAWLIKTDASGNKKWEKTFGGSNSDVAACVEQTSDGGYILTGDTYSFGAGQADAWLIKTDANGNAPSSPSE